MDAATSAGMVHEHETRPSTHAKVTAAPDLWVALTDADLDGATLTPE